MRLSFLFDLLGASISEDPNIIFKLLFFFKKEGIYSFSSSSSS